MILVPLRQTLIRSGLKYYSSALPKTIDIDGKTFKTDDSMTNVTPNTLALVGRNLHLNENHPVGILRTMIEEKLNSTSNNFKTYNNFKPVVSVYDNFDSLGFLPDHPGRAKTDTYYINKEFLLRTHTSAHEIPCFQRIKNFLSKDKNSNIPPEQLTDKTGFLISADVYRRDEIDRNHYPAFHQMEGACAWKRNPDDPQEHINKLRKDIKQLEDQLAQEKLKITLVSDDVSLEANPKQDYMSDLEVNLCSQHLKRSIELVVSEVFNQKIESMKLLQKNDSNYKCEIPTELKARWIRAYFPWTAPSWEIEVWWQNDWLELCGCGIVREDLLLRSGYEKDSSIAWAFGLGLDRIAMLLFDILDIRLFWSHDKRFQNQFQKGKITTFQPYSRYPGTSRDVSFWLPKGLTKKDINDNDVTEIVRGIGSDLVGSVKLVDVFTNTRNNQVSVSYRIFYQSMDRNITNSEINDLQQKVCEAIVEKYNVELR
ncbi:hypothetical protein TBLA_0B02600 [Henningerozyma blattae CBS 6284]|uniref:Phenylalanine--tRNA ligase, mitochondrial n=1 Tax=Henningerozyma blattae (strain ATCC 34711 / CBS 6284 / DSM 70876 / NBRC 10599 / NRRL Y-10934 / UCD 77-7) TaxID=1071380 RepID=I2GYA0_HENB6|nr:hypothetical protein TBLA_0B02600 [Tetrapisispora blattae CBS 6284]CCH59102.1 hypothetical protein TBLA_0B02600 [Tetrapisispora blattae CBS 6284]